MKTKAKRKKARRRNPGILTVRNPAKAKTKAKKRRKARAKKARAGKKVRAVKRTKAERRTRANPFAWQQIQQANRSRRAITPEQLREMAKRDPEFAKALARHRRFHGSNPDSIEFVNVPGVRDVGFRYGVALGTTKAHEYEPHASSGRSNGPPFRHNFDKHKNATITSPDGKALLVAKRKGSKLRVTERGIIG